MESSHLKRLKAAVQILLLTLLVVALFLRLFTEIVVLPDDPTSLFIFQINPCDFIAPQSIQTQAGQGVWILAQDENGLLGQKWYETITHTATLALLSLSYFGFKLIRSRP